MKIDKLKKIMLLVNSDDDCKISNRLFKVLELISINKNFSYLMHVKITRIGTYVFKNEEEEFSINNHKTEMIRNLNYNSIADLLEDDCIVKIDIGNTHDWI
jgi:hypothetical protein